MTDTMQGLSLRKPRGYAGDFEIIDRIHTGRVSEHPAFVRWDDFFHAQPAPRAVRNRAQVLAQLLDELQERAQHARVLNIGCGPCRDVARWLASNPSAGLYIECLDRDPDAIAYAGSVLNGQSHRVRLVDRDVLRYRHEQPFDLVWSAGLFDYLNDRLFVLLLKRLKGALTQGGRMVVGNFSPANPSRNYMELCGEWYLHHRDEAELLSLAEQAGIDDAAVTSEAEGVNLFLIAHA